MDFDFGFGLLSHKQSGTGEKRDGSGLLEDRLRLSKTPKLDLSAEKCGDGFDSFGRSNDFWTSLSEGDGHNPKMLCFASSEALPQRCGNDSSSRSIAFSIPEFDRRLGGGGPFSRIGGPFTPSQRSELENQAWIYKHLVANVPVPSHLLLPLRRSLLLYGSPHGPYPSNLLGWGPFPLGFSGSNDPEPGRCRRTDGKKWRCSREAVPDHKYCERHINRGRHRSRKPVEVVPSNGCESNGLGALEARAPLTGPKPKEFSFDRSSEFGLVSGTNRSPYWQGGLRYGWTQLSMSTPDLSSQERALRPPQQEPGSVHAGLDLFEQIRESNGPWFPSMGGPLGEVLTTTATATAAAAFSMGGDSLRHDQLGSSPTGVLQRSTMLGGGSVSNSSSGS